MKDLNLIPKSYLIEEARRLQRIYISGAVGLSIMLLANGIVIPIQSKLRLEKQISDMDYKVKESTGFVTKEKLLNNLKTVYGEREQEANKLFGLGCDQSALFSSIEKSMTDKIFLINMNITDDDSGAKIDLNCMYETEDDIASFVNNLRQTDNFDSITVNGMSKVKASSNILTTDLGTNKNGNSATNIGMSNATSTKVATTKVSGTKVTTKATAKPNTKTVAKATEKPTDKFTSAITLHFKSKR